MKIMQFEKEMLGYDIMGASDLSDTIVCHTEDDSIIFTNIYGKTSSNMKDVIRTGKKYILIDYRKEKIGETNGWLAKYFPEYGILLAVFYELECDIKFGYSVPSISFLWEEKARFITSREECAFYVDGCLSMDYDILAEMEGGFDLCGQYIYDVYNFDGLSVPRGDNLNCSSGEEVRRLCGNCFWIYEEYLTFHCYNFLSEVAEYIMEDYAIFGINEVDMEGIEVGELRIPERITEILGKHFKKCLNNIFADSTGLWTDYMSDLFDGLEGCILENCGGEYVLRCFVIHINGNDDTNSGIMPIEYTEVGRIHITENILECMNKVYIPLLYFDRHGIEDGIFKYCTRYLEEAENETIDMIMKSNSTNVNPDYFGTVNFSAAMALCPFFEKFYNMFPKNAENGELHNSAESLKKIAKTCTGDLMHYLREIVGGINFLEEELNKALGISKPVLDLLREGKCNLEHIKMMKRIFLFHREILNLMDVKSALYVIHFIDSCNCFIGECDCYGLCMQDLIEMFGIQNYKKYIKLLEEEYSSIDCAETYRDYVMKIKFVKTRVTYAKYLTNITFRWKVKEKDLDKAYESVYAIYRTFIDEEKYYSALLKFREYGADWEKYNYHNGEFMVTYPKGPTDLIEEGAKLKHCVGNYIDIVSNGGTTILFIRKVNEPSKSFFTLEIRGNSIRQCHGATNCNASTYPGLMDFIREFCENKKLVISPTIDSRLNV